MTAHADFHQTRETKTFSLTNLVAFPSYSQPICAYTGYEAENGRADMLRSANAMILCNKEMLNLVSPSMWYGSLMHRNVFFIVVMECDAVELQERIRNFTCRRSHAGVEWNAFEPAWIIIAKIHTATFFDRAEVDCVNRSALMRDHRRLHVTQKCPRDRFEKGMVLDIRSSGP